MPSLVAAAASAASAAAAEVIDGPFSPLNTPWTLRPGETVNDNLPSGVTIHNYNDFSAGGTLTFKATLNAIRTASTSPYYIRLPAGTFTISDFSYGAGSTNAGYQDVSSTKRWGGFIGAGADQTFITLASNSMSAAQISMVQAGGGSPVPIRVFYSGSGGLPIPVFFSGLTFRGRFQQTAVLNPSGLTVNTATPTPCPYEGLFITSSDPDSRLQFVRFQGFGFAAKNSPPYECGAVNTLGCTYTMERFEVDGRLAPEISAGQPVASGGVMWNHEQGGDGVTLIDGWVHDTRRSGLAMHDHAPNAGGNASDQGIYRMENVQTERICSTSDSYAGSALGFSQSNVEELRRTFTYVRPRFNRANTSAPYHIVCGTSNSNSLPNGISVTDPIISDTTLNGCLGVRFIKQANSQGVSPFFSPYYNLWIAAGGNEAALQALPITVINNGVELTPILHTTSAGTRNPAINYVVNMT